MHITRDTVASYLQYMQDAFLIEKAQRYDVRGRHYIGTPMKYYFVDVGLRNARLNFRQNDYGHIMENVIYNELRMRGMTVDVGMVEVNSLKLILCATVAVNDTTYSPHMLCMTRKSDNRKQSPYGTSMTPSKRFWYKKTPFFRITTTTAFLISACLIFLRTKLL